MRRHRDVRGLAHPESGAAMLVVMMVLLVVTASATLAVYSSQFEIRATGHQRQAMQTSMVAEAGLVAATSTVEMLGGARVLRWRMEQNRRVGRQLSPDEPPLGTMNSETERLASNEMVPATAPNLLYPTTDAAGFGLSAFQPRFIVDITDGYNVLPTFVGQAAGTRVDGNGTVQLQYYVTTLSSRGRMVRNGVVDDAGGTTTGGVTTAPVLTVPEASLTADRSHLRRDIFETAATSRAVTISGPYAPM